MKFLTVFPALAPWKLGGAGGFTPLGKPRTSDAGSWVAPLVALGRSASKTATFNDKAMSCLIILSIVGSTDMVVACNWPLTSTKRATKFGSDTSVKVALKFGIKLILNYILVG